MPRLPSGAMNRDSTIAASADCACEMKIFSPLSIHSPVSRSKVAVVRMFAGSDPSARLGNRDRYRVLLPFLDFAQELRPS